MRKVILRIECIFRKKQSVVHEFFEMIENCVGNFKKSVRAAFRGSINKGWRNSGLVLWISEFENMIVEADEYDDNQKFQKKKEQGMNNSLK